MIESVQNFKDKSLYDASRDFFNTLNIPIDHITSKAIDTVDIFEKPHSSFKSVKNIYAIGMLNDAYFKDNQSVLDIKIKKDYQGILVFSIELSIENPTRKTLADISRAFNKEYHYTPVVILFKYGNKLSLSNTLRQKYKINKEGEKTGKVVILRDVDIDNPHRGHIDILEDMKITAKVNSYESLYQHWQNVFDVSLLNKKFYQELSHWYFYAVREVTFPSQPNNIDDATEHKSKNVIRLLTRFLFVWFIKEKGLIPNELFEEEYIKESLKDFNPKNMDGTLLGGHDKSSLYYKAILQNLFFASLNCPIVQLDENDRRARGFRKKDHYGQNRDANFLMRYEDSFTKPQEFLELVNEYVPFLNGGLFECLDDKTNNIYIDGFSDNLVKPHKLIVPDYLFFGVEDHVDLSIEYGIKNKAFKNATVKGLIQILDSYKFTVAENTPIEEDVALDPELLGRVFENLLASYNPETKTTARKQTGSFYTPREIVSYMVDESLIEYLKTKLEDSYAKDNLEPKLRELCNYSDIQPFEDQDTIVKLIDALDSLKTLDPAVGSGAFPMGMLQKMVHILSKLDSNNEYWKKLQKEKAQKESSEAFEKGDKDDKEARSRLLSEINNAFDETINNPDYARKLYIIENSIYGVDIQSIAIQISKLRFFISLVIEQKIDKHKSNFGVRPLPNLETKFIAANTLIGIDAQAKSFADVDTKIKQLENELKQIRHKLFNAKTPKTKRKLRAKDKVLREKISNELISFGFDVESANKLSSWDPYDQNASSEFFDMEWMFGIKDGFDIVIGNPPYVQIKDIPESEKPYYSSHYKFATGRFNLFYFFIENSKRYTSRYGITSFIVPDRILLNTQTVVIRNWLIHDQSLLIVNSFDESVFDSAVVDSVILIYKNSKNENSTILANPNISISQLSDSKPIEIPLEYFKNSSNKQFDLNYSPITYEIIKAISSKSVNLGEISETRDGIIQSKIPDVLFLKEKTNEMCQKLLFGKNVNKYNITYTEDWVNYNPELMKEIELNRGGGGLRLRKKEIFERTKILTRQTSDRIIGAIDEENYYYSNTLHGTSIRDMKYEIEFVLAILNSSLIDFYYKSTTAEGGKVFAQVKIELLRQIPIKYTPFQTPYVLIVKIISYLNNVKDDISIALFTSVLNSLVINLYFKEHMKEKQINIIEYVEKDIKEVMQDKDFENLDDTSKNKIIQILYGKWTHPDNQVRNRIKLFAVRSPNILKPILER